VPVIPERPQGFETLVLLILEQQVSIDSAKATFEN
jgi:DNA-3-methyladenine glycosylase II